MHSPMKLVPPQLPILPTTTTHHLLPPPTINLSPSTCYLLTSDAAPPPPRRPLPFPPPPPPTTASGTTTATTTTTTASSRRCEGSMSSLGEPVWIDRVTTPAHCARLTYEVSQDMHPPARKPQKCEDDMLELLPAGLLCCYRLVDLYTRSATYTGPKGS